jgi:hypothetical protein
MKIIKISEMNETEDWKRGFAAGLKYFLVKEAFRHQEDIAKAKNDIARLKNIHLPRNLTLGDWIEP